MRVADVFTSGVRRDWDDDRDDCRGWDRDDCWGERDRDDRYYWRDRHRWWTW